MIKRHQNNLQGFTLIELMISMAIFAMLSLMAFNGLDSVINNKQKTETALLRLNQLQLGMSKLHRDIEQITARPARDGLGSKLPALSAGQGDDLLIQFTRNGWRNPAKLARSHLQRVAYKLEDEKLIRLSWPYVDRAQDDPLVESVLLDNLKDVQIRFLDEKNSWKERWPSNNSDTSAEKITQPQAIEIKLEMNDWGEVSRVFRVPAA